MKELGDTYFEAKAKIWLRLPGWSENFVYYELATVPYVLDGVGNRTCENRLPLLKLALFGWGDWIEKANAVIQELKIRHKSDSAEIVVSYLSFDFWEIPISFGGSSIRRSDLLNAPLDLPDSD